MEEYLGAMIVGFLGIIFTLLARSLVKMYERLWNENNKKTGSPAEMYRIVLESMNDALKLQEDRERKRKSKTQEKPSLLDVPLTEEPEPGEEEPGPVDEAFEELKSKLGQEE